MSDRDNLCLVTTGGQAMITAGPALLSPHALFTGCNM
jgi:hypothetical protein